MSLSPARILLACPARSRSTLLSHPVGSLVGAEHISSVSYIDREENACR